MFKYIFGILFLIYFVILLFLTLGKNRNILWIFDCILLPPLIIILIRLPAVPFTQKQKYLERKNQIICSCGCPNSATAKKCIKCGFQLDAEDIQFPSRKSKVFETNRKTNQIYRVYPCSKKYGLKIKHRAQLGGTEAWRNRLIYWI